MFTEPFKKAEKRLREKQADPENYVWVNSEAEMPVQKKRTSVPNSRFKDYVVNDGREVDQGKTNCLCCCTDENVDVS